MSNSNHRCNFNFRSRLSFELWLDVKNTDKKSMPLTCEYSDVRQGCTCINSASCRTWTWAGRRFSCIAASSSPEADHIDDWSAKTRNSESLQFELQVAQEFWFLDNRYFELPSLFCPCFRSSPPCSWALASLACLSRSATCICLKTFALTRSVSFCYSLPYACHRLYFQHEKKEGEEEAQISKVTSSNVCPRWLNDGDQWSDRIVSLRIAEYAINAL